MTEKKFSYNAAMTEVEQILDALSRSNPDVDELTRQVKRATELLKACRKKLYDTDLEIQAVFENE